MMKLFIDFESGINQSTIQPDSQIQKSPVCYFYEASIYREMCY